MFPPSAGFSKFCEFVSFVKYLVNRGGGWMVARRLGAVTPIHCLLCGRLLYSFTLLVVWNVCYDK